MKMNISHARLLETLHYDPETGLFTCRIRRGRIMPGTVVGNIGNHGYIQLAIDSKMYLGQRVAWFYMTGHWPADQVDHVNRKKTDNRWVNLREATKSQNGFNKGPMSRNRSGFKGVSWNAKRGKWYAFIVDGQGQRYLGSFDSAEQAHAVYSEAALKYHGEFARVA